jgi:hypothetical protein
MRKSLLVAPACYTPRMNIPDWLQRRLANAFPGYFLQPDDVPSDAPVIVNNNRITINFTGKPEDYPDFEAHLLKIMEQLRNVDPLGTQEMGREAPTTERARVVRNSDAQTAGTWDEDAS